MTSAIETLLQAAKFLELQEQGLLQPEHHNNIKGYFESENQQLSTSLSPITSELENFWILTVFGTYWLKKFCFNIQIKITKTR